jgi:hypothetical protein
MEFETSIFADNGTEIPVKITFNGIPPKNVRVFGNLLSFSKVLTHWAELALSEKEMAHAIRGCVKYGAV